MCRTIEDMWKLGFKEGFKEGWQESKREIAQRMLLAGRYNVAEIADITELSVEEVKNCKPKRAFNKKFDTCIAVG